MSESWRVNEGKRGKEEGERKSGVTYNLLN